MDEYLQCVRSVESKLQHTPNTRILVMGILVTGYFGWNVLRTEKVWLVLLEQNKTNTKSNLHQRHAKIVKEKSCTHKNSFAYVRM